jgi:hypothetical protein
MVFGVTDEHIVALGGLRLRGHRNQAAADAMLLEQMRSVFAAKLRLHVSGSVLQQTGEARDRQVQIFHPSLCNNVPKLHFTCYGDELQFYTPAQLRLFNEMMFAMVPAC